jgi:hypothetical protein
VNVGSKWQRDTRTVQKTTCNFTLRFSFVVAMQVGRRGTSERGEARTRRAGSLLYCTEQVNSFSSEKNPFSPKFQVCDKKQTSSSASAAVDITFVGRFFNQLKLKHRVFKLRRDARDYICFPCRSASRLGEIADQTVALLAQSNLDRLGVLVDLRRPRRLSIGLNYSWPLSVTGWGTSFDVDRPEKPAQRSRSHQKRASSTELEGKDVDRRDTIGCSETRIQSKNRVPSSERTRKGVRSRYKKVSSWWIGPRAAANSHPTKCRSS